MPHFCSAKHCIPPCETLTTEQLFDLNDQLLAAQKAVGKEIRAALLSAEGVQSGHELAREMHSSKQKGR